MSIQMKWRNHSMLIRLLLDEFPAKLRHHDLFRNPQN
jgi:hypothetical protein